MTIGCAALSYVLFTALHACQFVVGAAVCVLYGIDIKHARDAGEAVDGKDAYAVTVGGLGALTALLLLVPFVVRFAFVWAWSLVMSVLWLALFGIFGRTYINMENPEGDGDIQRMKIAVWIVLAGAALWVIGAVAHFIYWWGHKDRRSRFTSRAKI
ncbi:hypothetical protein C8A05DRAFT_37078 [Staphylotrichum tortipilum]|uniref:Uncharacterized protein n=1 Tax=Staphylotrichum tortipilum TaxID=2831512 RepID=A0AAN6RRC0_9PEZI|nr:hypothetical protein C8A05DRAFT_37078 [Staphylotrichum longicolle]